MYLVLFVAPRWGGGGDARLDLSGGRDKIAARLRGVIDGEAAHILYQREGLQPIPEVRGGLKLRCSNNMTKTRAVFL